MLYAYWLTDVYKINLLGIEFGTKQQDIFRYTMVSRQFGQRLKVSMLFK